MPFIGSVFEPPEVSNFLPSGSITIKATSGFTLLANAPKRRLFGTRMDLILQLLQGDEPKRPITILTDQLSSEADRLLAENTLHDTKGAPDKESVSLLLQGCRCRGFLKANEAGTGWDLVIKDLSKSFTGAATKVFTYFDVPGGIMGGESESSMIPIKSLSPPPTSLLRRGLRTVVQSSYLSPDSRRAAQKTDYSDKAVKTTRPEDGPGDLQQPTARTIPAAGGPLGEAQRRGRAEWTMQNDGLELDLTSVGLPDLVPGEVIALQGLGSRLDRSYVVSSFKHTFSGSGFETSMKIKAMTVPSSKQASNPAAGPHGSGTELPSSPGASDVIPKPANWWFAIK
jgi:hypothetical protein